MAKDEEIVRTSLRLPRALYEKLEAATVGKTMHAEILHRLEASFLAAEGPPHSQLIIDSQREALEEQSQLMRSMMENMAHQNDMLEGQSKLLEQAMQIIKPMAEAAAEEAAAQPVRPKKAAGGGAGPIGGGNVFYLNYLDK